MTHDNAFTDVLTSETIRAAVRSLALANHPQERCWWCGELGALHLRIHPNAHPELLEMARRSGAVCPGL